MHNGYTINATKNWWGDDTGPYHPTENPNGKGDNVTDYVDFSPWLDEDGNFVYLSDLPDDEEPNRIPLYILFIILASLMIALVLVVHTSEIQ